MSASACVVFFGLRYEIDRNEIEALETRSDTRIVAAKKSGLQYYWANFGTPGERYLLFVGAKIAVLGLEDNLQFSLSAEDFLALLESTKTKLKTADLNGPVSLHLQWLQDLP